VQGRRRSKKEQNEWAYSEEIYYKERDIETGRHSRPKQLGITDPIVFEDDD
jgi:hypothetical protein